MVVEKYGPESYLVVVIHTEIKDSNKLNNCIVLAGTNNVNGLLCIGMGI